MSSAHTTIWKLAKEVFTTGICDAKTHNEAMDHLDELLSSFGDFHWKGPVANYAALPLAGNTNGDIRLTLDTLKMYVWNGVSWEDTNKAIIYKGVWDANTNTPPLASGVGLQGEYYVVGVSGNTNLDGITDWVVADWAIFNGTAWEKADHTDAVASVFGRKGAVTAQAGDYTHAQLAGIGADDHHARQHALSSALDHTGEITDLQHGNRAGGTLHPIATPDPAGAAGFMSSAAITKLNGIVAGAARQSDYQFGRSVRVPAGGTLYLFGPDGTPTGVRLNRAGTVTGLSLLVNVIDAARDYNLVLYINGAQAATLALPLNTIGVHTALLAVAAAAGDSVTVALVRTAGAGVSTFMSAHATVEVTF